MFTKVYFTLVTMLFLTAKGDPDPQDPQTFVAPTTGPLLPSPLPQAQYEQGNVIVYLTPEQITALQTGQGILEPVIEPQPQQEVEQQNQEQILPIDLEQGIDQENGFLGNQPFVIVQNQEENEPAPVIEPSGEEPQELSRYLSESNVYKTPDSSGRNKYNGLTQKQQENNRYLAPSNEKPKERQYNTASSEKPERLELQSYSYYSVYNQTKGDNINIKIIHPNAKLKDVLELKDLGTQKASEVNKKYKLVPYAYKNQKLSDDTPIQESSQSSRTSQNNKERQYAIQFTQSEENQESQEYELEDSSENEQNVDEELNESNYEARRNEERNKILDLLKKKTTEAEARKAAKRPVVIKNLSITNQVSVPQPYVVRVPQPVEANVPQPNPVPLEILRQIPIEIEENERVERQADKVETVRVPATKKVYVKVDKPILVERIVPVETRQGREVQVKPQKLRILGPTLKYFD